MKPLLVLLDSITETKDTVTGKRLGVLPGVRFRRLLESYSLCILARKDTVVRPPGVDPEQGPTVLQEPCLSSCLLDIVAQERTCLTVSLTHGGSGGGERRVALTLQLGLVARPVVCVWPQRCQQQQYLDPSSAAPR